MTDDANGVRNIALSKLDKSTAIREKATLVKEVTYQGIIIRELDTGTIEVVRDGETQLPSKPILRDIATKLDIELLNENGNPLNTRQLGSRIISKLQ